MMSGMKDNKDVACYFITKHSWKGKYKRIFSVGTLGITTYNPQTFEVTNQWPYREFVSIVPAVKAPANNEFTITMVKGPKKTESMKFSTDHRADLLTEALRFRDQFAEKNASKKRFNAFKQHWSESRVSVILEVTQSSLDQVDPTSGRILCSYDYKDMEGLAQVSDCPGGIAVIYGTFSRLHMFALEQRDELIKAVMESAAAFIGVAVKQRKQAITLDQFLTHRLGKYSSDEALTSYAEFTVQKISERHTDSVRRTLCLTEQCLVERDPATYNIVTCKPLCDIFAIIRDVMNPQLFSVEYVKGAIRTYLSTDRDALIASVLDGVRASGNRDVCVRMVKTSRGYRLGPFTVPVDEEVESQHLKFIQSPQNMTFHQAVHRFNSNISYSGLLHAVTQDRLFAENKEKLINGALSGLLENEGDQKIITVENLQAQFHALRRLVASKAGFMAFTKLPKMREKVGLKVVKALKRNDDGVTHAALDMLCALMVPMHDDYDLRQEQLNKSSLLSSKKFLQTLLDMFNNHVIHNTGALVITAMLDFLTFALCAPYSETTDGGHFDTLLETVAANGRIVFRLFQHPSTAIVKGAGLIMKAIIEEGDAEIAAKMQDLALAEGALPRHLHTSMFTQSADNRMLTNRQLSRHLVGLWVTGHPTAMGLLRRILPSGILLFLDSADQVPENEDDKLHIRDNVKLAQEHQNRQKKNQHIQMIEKKVDQLLQHWRSQIGLENKQAKEQIPIVLRKRRQRIKSEANWSLFYYQFNRDHAKPNLIWNFKTREELRECLENEMRAFNVDRELGSNCVICWNHQEFEVQYHCLSEEIKIGDYYLRLLLEEDENESEEVSAIKRSYEFFNDLYHRFLLTPKVNMKCMCLQAMTIVYGRCHEEIGAFNDTKFIVGMLERCTDKLERDRLILFLNKLIMHRRNVKEIMDANGIKVLVDLLTLAHLHTTRATVPLQTNVIEAGADMHRESEKEWYYGNKDKERLGPFSYEEMKRLWEEGVVHAKTRCWAQGMDGWRPLQSVPQLKWTLLSTSMPVMNETDLACMILNMFIKMAEYYPSRDADGAIVRPLPRVKRILSDAMCLPHIVQLLLTFDPILVEKVAYLLNDIMADNPNSSRLYLSGAFFFIMMYTGSNVVPIARFLKNMHTKQAFRAEENQQSSDLMMRSVLGHILPEAMVCYLENYQPEKFSQIFLGEFDTPEAIWNAEMRRMMIEKIASHLADFTPKLMSNTRALYQYCPIPVINYPQLENELFCNIYYLKHLCDTVKFPDWPIKAPVKLLKDILEAWKKEVEKKPPSMSIEDAYEVLNLDKGAGGHEESKIRKAYFRLAQKYHPDKNPEGREMFEKVNKAYEFLCSKTRVCEGPDPLNIVLILKAQCILFSRYSEELQPYKYAGYPMLIKTIQMESNDDQLFSKSAPLLAAASELAYHTVKCSALNAEELRRENGIHILQDAFSRCVTVLSQSSKPEDLAVTVCTNIAKCYSVAAQFKGCREKIQEHQNIIKDLCRILYYKNLSKLLTVVVECVSSFCIDFWLQTHLFQSGVLWHLLLYLFNYDYTLEESGVEKSDDTNKQEIANSLAKLSITACSRLGGYIVTNTDDDTPDNPAVKKSLTAMLTPYLSRKLSNPDSSELLKLLNCNSENPYLIWDNATRGQLTGFLSDQQQKMIKTGECDPDFGGMFVFEIHAKELVVGEVFVRIYNEQPTFPLENPKGFTIDLLDFLGSQAQYLHSLLVLQKSQQENSPDGQGSSQISRLGQVEMALEALRNVIKNNPGVEIQCIGHFRLLFCLLRLDDCARLQQLALELISCVAANQECVKDIAASEVLAYLLLAIQLLPKCRVLTLESLAALMSSTQIVKEAMAKGATVYLLDLFCNSTNPSVREKTAELFAKMLADKLVGPKVRIILGKFLPGIFMDAMRDSSEASVHMFEGTHENPELIWNDESREKVSGEVKRMKNMHYKAQRDNPDLKWTLPEEFRMVYNEVAGELVVGGVFLRLYIANPGWVLRKPKEFLTELLELWSKLVSLQILDGEKLETVTTAIVGLFSSHGSLVDQVPSLGYIPSVFTAMREKNTSIPKSAVQVCHQLANSEICIRAMAQVECIGPIKMAMKTRRDSIALAAEALSKMFDKGEEEFVQQALKTETVQYLLRLLEGGLEAIDNPASTKAQIVKALKAMQRSLLYAEQVNTILDNSPTWREYKDQKHDLFITNTNIAGYLTGGTGPNVAGYLTAGTRTNLPDKPPPLEHPEDH